MKARHVNQCIGRIPPYRFSPDGFIFEVYDRSSYLRGQPFKEVIETTLKRLAQVVMRSRRIVTLGWRRVFFCQN
jgi:hypothetical protein